MAKMSRGDVAVQSGHLYAALTETGLTPARARLVIQNPELAARLVGQIDQFVAESDAQVPDFHWDEGLIELLLEFVFLEHESDGSEFHRSIEQMRYRKGAVFSEIFGDNRRKEYTLFLKLNGYSIAEIGKIVNRSPSSVSSALARARSKIFGWLVHRHKEMEGSTVDWSERAAKWADKAKSA